MPIPIHILTGFLGSGKSTLLGRLIRRPAFRDTVVIVNEFGDVGIDHALIARGHEDNVVLLESGCICCTLTTSLEDTLEALFYRRARGEIGNFSRCVVETTGLADPGPVATALSGGLFVSRHFQLGGIMAVVDLQAGASQIAAHDEARRQVAMSDRIVLTKVDIASPEDAARTRAAVDSINPWAAQRPAAFGEVEGEWLVAEATSPPTPADSLPGRRDRRLAEPQERSDDTHDIARDHGHDGEYTSIVVRVHDPVSWTRYADWMEVVRRRAGGRLLRAKGFLRFDDGVVRTIQGVRQLFAAPTPPPTPVPVELAGTIVLIGHQTTADELQALIEPLVGRSHA